MIDQPDEEESQLVRVSDPELIELLRETENWTPAAREKAMAQYDKRKGISRKLWFCQVGRTCDGLPHDGAPYNHARGKQWPPGDHRWRMWLVMSGRGFGKTRMAGEWMRAVSNKVSRSAMIARRGVDIRATLVEGESGLIAVCESAGVPFMWEPSKKEFTFTATGAKIFGYSAEEPDSLRGPQFGAAWMDEPAHFDLIDDVWMNLKYGLRLPGLPGGAKVLCTTTPLPKKWIKEMRVKPSTRLTTGSSYENMANLDESYKEILSESEGTRNGRQEIYGEVLEDIVGALWNSTMFQHEHVKREDIGRIVVAIDPAGSTNKRSDETGIVVVGKYGDGFVVLEDLTEKLSPHGWSSAAVRAYQRWNADAIVAEKNFGGDMVKTTIQHALDDSKDFAKIEVMHAARSKQLRAEPVVGLYEQERAVHLLGAELTKLEGEQCEWVPGEGDSPNRIDALVWGVTSVMKLEAKGSIARPRGKLTENPATPGTRRAWRRGTAA